MGSWCDEFPPLLPYSSCLTLTVQHCLFVASDFIIHSKISWKHGDTALDNSIVCLVRIGTTSSQDGLDRPNMEILDKMDLLLRQIMLQLLTASTAELGWLIVCCPVISTSDLLLSILFNEFYFLGMSSCVYVIRRTKPLWIVESIKLWKRLATSMKIRIKSKYLIFQWNSKFSLISCFPFGLSKGQKYSTTQM